MDHPGLFYSRITSFIVLTLLTSSQLWKRFWWPQPVNTQRGINTPKSEFTRLFQARLIAERTPLKMSEARQSNGIWLRRRIESAENCWTHAGCNLFCFGGFDCRCTHASSEGGAGMVKVKVNRKTFCPKKEFLGHSNVFIHGQLSFQFFSLAPFMTWLLHCCLRLRNMDPCGGLPEWVPKS